MIILSSLGMVTFTIDSKWGWDTWWYDNFKINGYQLSYMVRTVFDSLSNVYNQFIPVILGLVIFLRLRKIKDWVFICLLVLPFSPFGFVGLFVLQFAEWLSNILANNKNKIRQIIYSNFFSIANFSAICTIFPVFLSFFLMNNAANTINKSLFFPLSAYTFTHIAILLLYYLLQFGIYLYFCHEYNDDKILYWAALISLLLFPFLHIGNSADFCWNSSVPAFYLIMIFMFRYHLKLDYDGRGSIIKKFLLCIVTCIMILTPTMQLGSMMYKCIKMDTFFVDVDDSLYRGTFSKAFEDDIGKYYSNFLVAKYKDKIFFKYLAK